MKVLIIGCKGFIGSYLTDYLLKKDFKVTGCDILENNSNNFPYHCLKNFSADLQAILQQHAFEICINTAGAANVYNSIINPLADFEANVLTVANILDGLKKYQPGCKYFHLSSAAVYGNPAELPIKENAKLAPVSPYGYHKLMSEFLCKEYYHLYKIPIAILRPFSVYGNGLRKQIFWDICSKLKKSDYITLFGTGNETRDFLHISDLVTLIEIIIKQSSFKYCIYNAAGGSETTIQEVAAIFEQYYGNNKKIQFNGETKPGDPLHWKASIAEISSLGFTPQALLNKSINDYINWFNSVNE